jgi:hypothetical protein
MAGAAFARAAAEMRSGQAEPSAQNVEQERIGIGIDLGRNTIEAKSRARHGRRR